MGHHLLQNIKKRTTKLPCSLWCHTRCCVFKSRHIHKRNLYIQMRGNVARGNVIVQSVFHLHWGCSQPKREQPSSGHAGDSKRSQTFNPTQPQPTHNTRHNTTYHTRHTTTHNSTHTTTHNTGPHTTYNHTGCWYPILLCNPAIRKPHFTLALGGCWLCKRKALCFTMVDVGVFGHGVC